VAINDPKGIREFKGRSEGNERGKNADRFNARALLQNRYNICYILYLHIYIYI